LFKAEVKHNTFNNVAVITRFCSWGSLFLCYVFFQRSRHFDIKLIMTSCWSLLFINQCI